MLVEVLLRAERVGRIDTHFGALTLSAIRSVVILGVAAVVEHVGVVGRPAPDRLER